MVVLYDGHCSFCTAQMKRLQRFAKPGALEPVDFQQPGALGRFPQVTYEQCMEAMQVITDEGRVFSGAEAVARAVATRAAGKVAYAYYVPGVRQLADAIYRAIAKRRYRIGKKECADGACAVHYQKRG